MGSFKKLSADKQLDRCEFFNSLKDGCISEKDYLHAIDVWIVFKMNAMGDYHDLYLKTDVSLLADVFEKFINMCLEYYGLDPCHYLSSLGLSWDAILKMTEISDLFQTLTCIYLLKKELQEVFLTLLKNFSKVKNKYTRSYDSSKPSKYIMYLDANNLYRWAMIQYLPYSKLKWLNQKV